MEITLPDGSTVREGIHSDTIAQRLIGLLQDNGALAPAWQVQTVQAHLQQLQEQGASPQQIQRQMHAGQGGQASAGDAAYALQGNAVESADFTCKALAMRRTSRKMRLCSPRATAARTSFHPFSVNADHLRCHPTFLT